MTTLSKMQDLLMKGFSYAMIGACALSLATTAVGSYNVLIGQ